MAEEKSASDPDPASPSEAGPDRIADHLAQHDFGTGEPPSWIQTHISHVFIAGDRVYKLRKSVRHSFVDFSTRAERNADCERELHLNRRLAPDVYLGIAPIRLEGVDGRVEVRIGEAGERAADPDCEHAVVMRRLPEGRDALALLRAGRLVPEQLERVAETLAAFHRSVGLGTPAPWSPEAWRAALVAPVRACVTELERSGSIERERLARLDAALSDHVERLAPAFEARRRRGCAVDAHGDLHIDHVWLETDDAPPLLVDCLEFDPALRHIDRASEVAFLSMDLRYRGRPDLAEAFLSAYAVASDDYDLFRVVGFFEAYRALVRAKVAAIASGQASVEAEQRAAARESAERHLALAERLLEPDGRGGLLLLCGTVGCGKSTVARARAGAGEGIRIASDRVRKAIAGLAPTARAGDGVDQGLYAADRREAVYEALLERAEPVVASGRVAILDASFTRRADRERAADWARARGVDARLLEVRCAEEVARERLEARAREDRDASDAGPDFLPVSLARFEPPDEWPAERREVVRTDP